MSVSRKELREIQNYVKLPWGSIAYLFQQITLSNIIVERGEL